MPFGKIVSALHFLEATDGAREFEGAVTGRVEGLGLGVGVGENLGDPEAGVTAGTLPMPSSKFGGWR